MRFSREVKSAAINAWVAALAVSGAAFIVADLILPSKFSISRPYILIWLFFSVIYLSGTLIHKHIAPEKTNPTSPKFLRYIKPGYMNEGGFVVQTSPWLQQNLLYAIILEEDAGFERLIGAAKYVMTQENKMIQLMVIARTQDAGELWQRLDRGETDQLRNMRVKMGVPEYV